MFIYFDYDLVNIKKIYETEDSFDTCLLANTSKAASLNSSSFNILFNSSFASLARSLSFESTTKIKPR